MSMPNISERVYICWQGDTPSEPTTTLVTTSKENYFVDIRIYRRFDPSGPDLPLPTTGGPIQRLEWAFAGISESWDFDTDSTSSAPPLSDHDVQQQQQPKNARWWHWVDSTFPLFPAHWLPATMAYEQAFARPPHVMSSISEDPFVDIASPTFSNASTLLAGDAAATTTLPPTTLPPLTRFAPVLDAGVLHPVPHDAALTLETGVMPHPATGLQTPYEEMWRDVVIEAAEEEKGRCSVVLTLEMAEICARGVLVRVGQWCQGVLMIGTQITCERWEFVSGEGAKGEWVRRVRIGDGFLPTGVVFSMAEVKVGDVCRKEAMVWVVREKFEWSE
ncbi:hypothetical protein BU16DRAFT_523531 [Lophium mytilinum]|uniref:Protein HRI1 n=1 Tax=Lophium mytilinum TaxID=390894 RepID=A0A6A6RBC6_9PEZI|nr:hypothetical protein BU16DRAFT_523531 [Lophium mytilinum]